MTFVLIVPFISTLAFYYPLFSWVLTHRLFFDCVPSIKDTVTTMLARDLAIAHASSVDGMWESSHGPNTENSAVSFASASNCTTASQVQETRQPEGTSSDADHQPISMLLGVLNFHNVQALPVPGLITGDALVNNVPVTTGLLNTDVAKGSSTGPQASIIVSGSNPQISSGKTNLAHGTSTSTPLLGVDSRPGLLSGTQTIPATSDSQDELPSDETLSLVSNPTYGSGTSISAQSLPISITQALHDSSSTASLLFHPIATPRISREPSPLTISGQTVTANSLGQYSIDNQTLTAGGVITVSGSKISLAPNASDLIIGTRTETLGPSVSAYIGSGPNGTEIQRFTGNALGTSDGLWSSSMMLLISFLLMLWV